MKIVIACTQYWPTVGGLPVVTDLLCRALVRSGHEVVLFTLSRQPTDAQQTDYRIPFRIVRKPSLWRQFITYCRSDGVIVMQPSIRLGLLPRLVARRHLVVHHAVRIHDATLPSRIRNTLLRLSRRGANEAACSRWLAVNLGRKVRFVPNPYNNEIFFEPDGQRKRDIDVLFVASGLTVGKGLFLLCDAISSSMLVHLVKRFVIVAPPVGEDRLRQYLGQTGIEAITEYKGALPSTAVADLMRRSLVLAAPSCCNEAFGLVALEAGACGAVVVATRDGGLPEAAGPGALIVKPGNVNELATAIATGLSLAAERQAGKKRFDNKRFLEQHQPSAAAARYIEVLFGEGRARTCRDSPL